MKNSICDRCGLMSAHTLGCLMEQLAEVADHRVKIERLMDERLAKIKQLTAALETSHKLLTDLAQFLIWNWCDSSRGSVLELVVQKRYDEACNAAERQKEKT